ncbi:MAG: hypothetical protein IJH64_05260 [Oscillospiraceae bacterium]|nr:hypothetical protein [Oscillospiraceae bacterium]
MTRKKIILFAGAAVVLTGIIAASLILMKGRHSEVKGSQEVTTEREEEADDEGAGRTGDREREMETKDIKVYGIGFLYYLDPDADQEFEERLTAFVAAEKIEADSAFVLETHVDDRSDEKEPAVFYLKLDNKERTIIQVSFEKTSGHYDFAVSETEAEIDALDDEDCEEGRTEHEIPENRKEEEIGKNPVSITDPDGDLERAADMEDLKAALEEFLGSIDEERRNFIVSSAGITEAGYEAILDFKTVRLDGRNVEVRYDGTYHFQLI